MSKRLAKEFFFKSRVLGCDKSELLPSKEYYALTASSSNVACMQWESSLQDFICDCGHICHLLLNYASVVVTNLLGSHQVPFSSINLVLQ